MTKPTILDADNMDQIIHIDELDDNDNLRRVAEENVVACHNERLVYGWRKIMENITRGYGHHE